MYSPLSRLPLSLLSPPPPLSLVFLISFSSPALSPFSLSLSLSLSVLWSAPRGAEKHDVGLECRGELHKVAHDTWRKRERVTRGERDIFRG